MRVREAKFVRDEICTFLMFGVHVVKKNIIFHTFFTIVFIPHVILRNKKMHEKLKKVRFLALFSINRNKKSFFQHFFCIFLTEKFSIFNFSPHYKKFHFYFFPCSSYGKHLKKRQHLRSYWFWALILEKKCHALGWAYLTFFLFTLRTKENFCFFSFFPH